MRQPPGPDDPTTVDRFRIVGVLGSGGMGRVLLGESPDGRLAAIKLVHPELADDEGFRARFRREVRLAAQAPPGWTAPFLDADPDAERPWLATAYLDAPSLLEHLDSHGPFDVAGAAALGAGLAAALSALHSAGLVHRDLKPSNVLLTDGGPRLIDFGISRAVDGTALTATGQSVGTPEYMSPEQVVGADAGPASDVFSLASLLVFALHLRSPFAAGSATGALYRVVHDEPDLPPATGALGPLLHACLAKEPAARPRVPEVRDRLLALVADAPEVADDGGAHTRDERRRGAAAPPDRPAGTRPDGTPPDARKPQPTRVGGPPPVQGPRSPVPPPPPGAGRAGRDGSPDRRRTPLLVAGAVLVAVLVGVGGTLGVLALRPDPATGSGSSAGPAAAGGQPGQAAATSSNPFLAPSTSAAPTRDPAAGARIVDTSQDVRFGDPAGSLRFASPSGNIACVQGPFDVRCDVVERTWQVPPPPSSCQLAYGTGVELAGSAAATLSCVGDTVADASLPRLDYGDALRSREVTCISRSEGVECVNTSTGHGFAVSRGAYRLY